MTRNLREMTVFELQAELAAARRQYEEASYQENYSVMVNLQNGAIEREAAAQAELDRRLASTSA